MIRYVFNGGFRVYIISKSKTSLSRDNFTFSNLDIKSISFKAALGEVKSVQVRDELRRTVEIGYNETGYNEQPDITSRFGAEVR